METRDKIILTLAMGLVLVAWFMPLLVYGR